MQGNGKSENERIHNWKGRKGCWCRRGKELAQRKVDAILDKIAGLKKAEATLSDLVEQCSGEGPVEGCPIIEAFIDDEFREES